MELSVYSVFDKVDGCSDRLFLSRSDERIVREIVSGIESENKRLKEKGFPLVSVSDYELRKIGIFEDTTCVINPLSVPLVIPLVLS